MARFYDRMAAHGRTAVVDGHAIEVPETLRRDFEDATVFVADNVARYFFAENPQEEWGPGDFPVVAPPVNPMWLEFDAPSHIVSEKTGVHRWEAVKGPVRSIAWLIAETAPEPQVGARRMQLALFLDQDHTGPSGPICWWDVHFKTDGSLYPEGTQKWRFVSQTPTDHPMTQQWMHGSGAYLHTAFLALSFMHCKNVEVRTVEPARLSPHLRRKGKKPQVRYHVLDIDPMKRTLKTEGRSGEVGLKKALHICRGHFATYTEDAPLFGKYVGTFWKPQHVRGNAKHGAVVKDYNVKAPR